MASPREPPALFTVGHSNRRLEDFLALLGAHGIRNLADYMDTAEFRAGLDGLLALRAEGPTAVLCAEALPWRCHRNLVADAVLVRGIPVYHILSNKALKPHTLPDFARVDRASSPPRITYPPKVEDQVGMELD